MPPRENRLLSKPQFSQPELELVIERDGVALAKGINRRADTSESEAPCSRDELPRRKRLPQSRCNNPDRHEDDPGNDHGCRQKEGHRAKAVSELRAVAVEERASRSLRRSGYHAEHTHQRDGNSAA